MKIHKKRKFLRIDHLAGIIPVGGAPLDFKMPWHDSLIPIAPNYLAIERAVLECAIAGCNTIWITGHKGITPLIRKRLGDFIKDPITLGEMFPGNTRKDISIFYVPITPRDYDKRDSLGWSVLHGADSAFRISCYLSKWLIPRRFYCTFPYGILPVDFIRDYRLKLRGENKYAFTYQGKSIKDNLHLSFSFDAYDYKVCRDVVKNRAIEQWEERKLIDSREFTLDKVFAPLDFSESVMVELPWFYDISSWEKYCFYTASEHSKNLRNPEGLFTREKRKMFPNEKDLEDAKQSRKNLQQALLTNETKPESTE